MFDEADDKLDDDEFEDQPGSYLKLRDKLPARMVLPVDPDGEFDDAEIAEFYEKTYNCYGPDEIAWSLGWSQLKLRQFLNNPERLELVESLREALNQGMERAVYRAGKGGNVTAQRLWLFCQARHRGWADTRQVHVTALERREVLISVAAGTQQAIREGVAAFGEDAILALQRRHLDVDVIEATVVDAD